MTLKKKISSLRNRPEASIAEAQGKFMKPAIVIAAFLSLILVSGIAPAAAPKYKTSKTTLSPTEILRLTSKQRAIYLNRLARVIERIEVKNPGLTYRPKARKSYSWIEQLLGTAHAQSNDLRCIYGGEPIYGSECKPLTSKEIRIIDSNGQASNRLLECGSGTVLCGPFTYGLGATGYGLCLPPQLSSNAQKTFTQRCSEAAFDGDQTTVRTAEQISWVLKGMPEAWTRHSQAIDQICSDEFINNNDRVNNRADLRNTCAVAKQDVASIRETQQEVAAQLANQNAETTQATSSPAQDPASRRPRVRTTTQTRPEARPPRVALDEETLARTNGQELASAQDARVAAAVADEEQGEVQGPSSAQAGLCQDIKLSGSRSNELTEAACESCRIEVSEKNATNDSNFKVSDKWMGLMATASKICGQPINKMVKEFGYCEERSDWKLESTAALKTIMENSGSLKASYDNQERDNTFSDNHFAVRSMKSEFGFKPAFIAELFCGDKQQFREGLNFMLQHEAALRGQEEQHQAYSSFKSCASEALGMSEVEREELAYDELQFIRENPISRYDQLSCEPELLEDFYAARNVLKDTKEPVLVKTGRASSCQVMVSEGSDDGKTMVFNGSTGQVEELDNFRLFNERTNRYQTLSCDSTQYRTGDQETDNRLRDAIL